MDKVLEQIRQIFIRTCQICEDTRKQDDRIRQNQTEKVVHKC